MLHWTKVVGFLWVCTCLLVPLRGVYAQQAPEQISLSLSEAVEAVLQQSPMSSVADAGLVAAEQGKKSARGEFLPKLKTTMDYTFSHEVPEIEIPSLVPGMPPQSFPAGSDRSLTSQTTLEQPVFTGLALLSQYNLADLDRKSAGEDRRKIRQGLILQAVEAYYGILVADKFLGVAKQALTQLESHAEVSRQFYENGMIPKNDLLKTLVSLADVKQKRIKAAHDLELAWSQFKILLRVREDTLIRLTESLSWKPYQRSLEACTNLALHHHPDILMAQLDVEKGAQSVKLARSGFFPQIALVGGLLHEEGGFAETEHLLSATVHADWTVWEWGSNYYKVKQNKSRLLMARAKQTQGVDTVKLKVYAAYLDLSEWRESIDVAQASIEQAEENYRITVEQYNENITTSTEVLDAQTLQAQAQVNYYSALSNYNIAVARLEKAMGTLQNPIFKSLETN